MICNSMMYYDLHTVLKPGPSSLAIAAQESLSLRDADCTGRWKQLFRGSSWPPEMQRGRLEETSVETMNFSGDEVSGSSVEAMDIF